MLSLLQANILITDQGSVLVTDVGLNTLIVQSFQDAVPVPFNWMYKPPEELQQSLRTPATDVYSFGSTIYSVRFYMFIPLTN